jgi:outer membrane receptor protein involved in Fe transport
MRIARFLNTTMLAGLAGLAVIATPAIAADDAPAADDTGDIIVTATKRNERLMQTALPMSAVTGEALAAANANSLGDYITRLPGVVFNDYQPGVSEVVIRGVAATTYHEQGQTTVGYYINEIPVVEPGFPIGIPDVDTFDLSRVEVLRGPQGTLFGSSTLGGLVNYIVNTADASKIDAAASGLIGSTKNASGDLNYAAKAMINLPIIEDKLAVRVMALQRFDAGFADNIATKENGSSDFRTRGIRGSIVWTPAPGTKVTYLSAYQDTKLDDQTYVDFARLYTRNLPRDESQKTDFFLNSLRLDQTFDFATLTVIGSVDKKTNSTVFSYPYAYATGKTTGDDAAYGPGHADANIKTIEARLASTATGPFEWLVGVSYLRSKKTSYDQIFQKGAEGVVGSVLAPGDRIYGYLSDSLNEDLGIFGELSFKPVEQIELTVGGRYYDTKAKASVVNQASFVSGSLVDLSGSTNQKEDGFTPKVTLAWRPTGEIMVYATYSKGFRVGGINPNAGLLPTIPESYESDKVDNYEAGVKATLLDGRLSLDATVFHLDWKNIQARLFGPAPSYYSYVFNAGGADVDGVEFAGTVKFTDWATFTSNVTYQDAELTEFLPDTFGPNGGYAKGTTLPGSSKWTVANNLVLGFQDVTGKPTFEVAHFYLSKAPTAFAAAAERGGYSKFDVRASIGIGENFRILGFVNNLFDKKGVLSAPFADSFSVLGSIIRPRTYGLRADWHL